MNLYGVSAMQVQRVSVLVETTNQNWEFSVSMMEPIMVTEWIWL